MAGTDVSTMMASMSLQERQFALALSVVIERVMALPKTSKDELFELAKDLAVARSNDEIQQIGITMMEVIERRPVVTKVLPIAGEPVNRAAITPYLQWISGRVVKARAAAKLTQVQLARKSGLPQSHISRIESGKLSPSRATLEKLAKALGVSMAEFDWEEPRH